MRGRLRGELNNIIGLGNFYVMTKVLWTGYFTFRPSNLSYVYMVNHRNNRQSRMQSSQSSKIGLIYDILVVDRAHLLSETKSSNCNRERRRAESRLTKICILSEIKTINVIVNSGEL